MKITNTHKFFDTLLLTLLVFSGGGLLFVFNRNLFSVILLLVSLFTIVFMGREIKKSIFNSSLITLSFFSFLVLINYMIFPKIEIMGSINPNLLNYGFHLMNITSCVIIFTHFKNNRSSEYFLGRMRYILKIILYFSIINFLAYFFVKSQLTDLYSSYNNDLITKTYNYLFFFHPEKNEFNFFGIGIVRNQGWFWEPGINQIYLNILLYLEGFVFKRGRWTIPLIIFAILTTYSTSGIFIMIIVLFFIFIRLIKRNRLLILLAIILSFPLYYIAKLNIEDKTIGEKSSSFQKRYLDLVQPLAIASDYPITGVGLDRTYFLKLRSKLQIEDNFGKIIQTYTGFERTSNSTDKGSSNSLTYLMASMGFPIAFFIIYCLFKQTLFPYKKKVFMLIILISVLSEPLLLRPFFLIFIVSGMISFFSKFTKLKIN